MAFSFSNIMMTRRLAVFAKQTGLGLYEGNIVRGRVNGLPVVEAKLRFHVLDSKWQRTASCEDKVDALTTLFHDATIMSQYKGLEFEDASELITRLMQENLELRKRLGEAEVEDDLTLEED